MSRRFFVENLDFDFESKVIAKSAFVENTGWIKVAGLLTGNEIAIAEKTICNRINEYVSVLPDDDILFAPLLSIQQVLLLQPISFPLFFTLPFGIHKYACENKHNAQNADNYSPAKWEFFKKITCQPNYKYSLAQISSSFSDKFYFIFIDNFLHINECALFLNYGDDQYTSELTRKPEIQKRRTILTSSIISFIFGLDKYTATQECYTANIQSNSQENGKLLKEITRQANGKNRFSQIGDYFCNKFSSYFFDNSHWFNIYHILSSLSRNFMFAWNTRADFDFRRRARRIISDLFITAWIVNTTVWRRG